VFVTAFLVNFFAMLDQYRLRHLRWGSLDFSDVRIYCLILVMLSVVLFWFLTRAVLLVTEHGRLAAAYCKLAGVCNTWGEASLPYGRQSSEETEGKVRTEAVLTWRVWYSRGGPHEKVLPTGRDKGLLFFYQELISSHIPSCSCWGDLFKIRCVSNKLHSIKPLLGYSNLSSLSRQDAVVLRRLRIGHTRLTHSYHLLNRQDQPQCSNCDCALTVAHVLLECNHYNVVRQRCFNVSSVQALFDTINAQNILGFISDIGLYHLL